MKADSTKMEDVASTPIEQQTGKDKGGPLGALRQVGRIASFWRRGGAVYLAYKGAQIRAAVKRRQGWETGRLRTEFWTPHHQWAGEQFYSLAVDLRGFYLKIGQFFAARAEFVPEPICKKLALLHDQVPPMPVERTRAVIEQELRGAPIEEVFEWIDLDNVLGSASIAQVHKAKLRGRKKTRRAKLVGTLLSPEPASAPKGPVHDLRWLTKRKRRASASEVSTSSLQASAESNPAEAARRAAEDFEGPNDGIVAVKVQYPDALPVMMGDLKQIRRFAGIIQKLEINFDMLSAVDELAEQVRLEFDFEREARVMDTIADDLKNLEGRVEVPRSVLGLVTRRLLVMNFLEGEQITRLKERVKGLSAHKQAAAKQRILHRVADAYGQMILNRGLFQADPHAGNILVMKGAKIGLIDYGQSKQLPEAARLGFARLVLEMAKGRQHADPMVVSRRLQEMGLRFTNDDNRKIQAMMAFGMFDTELSHRVDPFSLDSPIKKLGIKHFPSEVFFVLRTVQMLRGLAMGMKQPDFSTAKRWQRLARGAVEEIN